MEDTHPRILEQRAGLYRAMSPAQRVGIAIDLTRMADEAALVGIRERHPGCSEDDARILLAALKYGPDLVRRAYGRLPGDAA